MISSIYTKTVSSIIFEIFDKICSAPPTLKCLVFTDHYRLKKKKKNQIFFRRLHLCEISSKSAIHTSVCSPLRTRNFSSACISVKVWLNGRCNYWITEFTYVWSKWGSLQLSSPSDRQADRLYWFDSRNVKWTLLVSSDRSKLSDCGRQQHILRRQILKAPLGTKQ